MEKWWWKKELKLSEERILWSLKPNWKEKFFLEILFWSLTGIIHLMVIYVITSCAKMLSIRSMPTSSSSYGKGNKSRKMVEKEQTEHGSKDMAIRDEDKYFC